MTGIPTVPGPFSFLESAGEALGSYAQEKEERKRHAQQLAEHGMNSLLQDILQGLKPAEMLDDPNVAAMSKTAYGYAIPRGILPQPKEILQKRQAAALQTMKPGGAAERAATGVPSEEVAGAAESKAKLEGRTAEAKLTAGVPEAEADTQAAIAAAQKEGAQLNQNIFKGARALLGSDPKFARLSYEAATGALDARLRLLEYNRANLTLERQRMADNARILLDALQEGGKRYDAAVKDHEAQLRVSIIASGKDPDDPEVRKTFEEANPAPDQDKIVGDYIQSTFGFDKAEYQRRLKEAMSGLTGPDTTGTTARPAQPKAGQPKPTSQAGGTNRVQTVVTNASRHEPDEAGELLARAVQDGDLTDLEASAIVAKLKETQPGSWFKKFNKSYAGSSLSGSREQR